MTDRQLNELKAALEAKLTGVKPAIRRRDGIEIERAADVLDQIQLAAERELATRNLERESKMYRNVRAALDRIEEGAYGSCLECEEEIGIRRLQALPWTPLCIRCQEAADQIRDEEVFLPNAA